MPIMPTPFPNLVSLLERGAVDEAAGLLRAGIVVVGAHGPRSTDAALAASRLFGGDLKQTILFMDTPHPYLAGACPRDHAEMLPSGLQDVLQLIARAEAGVYG